MLKKGIGSFHQKKNHQNENSDKLDFVLSKRQQNPELFSQGVRYSDKLLYFIPRNPKSFTSHPLPLTFRLAKTLVQYCSYVLENKGEKRLREWGTEYHSKRAKKHQDGSDWLSCAGAAWGGTKHLSGLIYEQAGWTAKEILEASTKPDPKIETAMEMVCTPKPHNTPFAYNPRCAEDLQLQNHTDVPREHQHLGVW